MKYFAVIIIICCVILNFMIIRDYGDKQVTNPVKAPQVRPAATGQGVSAAGGTDAAARKPVVSTVNVRVQPSPAFMKQPSFYRGIYLHNYSARVPRILSRFIREAKTYRINAFVLDLQDAVYFRTHMVSRNNVKMCLTNGIYPIARIVVFPYGLKRYPVPAAFLQRRIDLAVRAAKAGFPEVQFDYIRFEDSSRLRHVPRYKRFALVEGFLARAKRTLARYGTRVSADVFGRVTLNRNDPIGQRLEGLDGKVDILCPMVYPSHFTWSRYMMANPYYTVYKSSAVAKKRLRKTGLVQYIQGFVMKVGYSGLSLPMYIAHQIKAAHDTGIRGYIVWNAAQRYRPTYRAMQLYYSGRKLTGIRPFPGKKPSGVARHGRSTSVAD